MNLTTSSFLDLQADNDFMYYFDTIIGYVYMLAWSSSFYGQVYENWKVKQFL
jgi:hypothetical protein